MERECQILGYLSIQGYKNMKTILVVGVEPTLFNKLENWFSKGEYAIIYSPDTEDKLKILVNKYLPDLIVVDTDVPELTGLSLGIQIRQWSATPLLILSTVETSDNEIRWLDLRSKSYLSEPYDISMLAIRINLILSANKTTTST
jgi:two-component system, OmpR family, KDP operon response regulator KdpE